MRETKKSFNEINEDVMNTSAKFWNKVAAGYSRQPIADEAAYQKKLQVTREYFQPSMEVLEFGCGTGSTAIAHAPYVQHIRAIDFSSNMIDIAQAKAEAQNIQNVTFEQASIDELSVPDRIYDAVLGLNVLHLLENKEAVIAKVHNMLQPGGLFITSTVCLGDTMAWFKLIAPIGKFLGLFPLVKVFTIKDLEKSLTDAGFAISYQWQAGDYKSPIGRAEIVFIVAMKAE
ncbi:MAG: class I SAM-dependent methyltransferase [Leptolyngbyaceae cyanobacterium MO_188.B28]|nr:class I SAM-dependent methyltransferase [Leptolyngbyaceae cyanobacterium MO_188.B28]